MTGYKPNKNNLSSSTSTAALATALITLTGHVKQVDKSFYHVIEAFLSHSSALRIRMKKIRLIISKINFQL
jgi:hypothetical protein